MLSWKWRIDCWSFQQMLGKETLHSSCFSKTASTITATIKQSFSPAIHFWQGTGVYRSDGKTLLLSLESSEVWKKKNVTTDEMNVNKHAELPYKLVYYKLKGTPYKSISKSLSKFHSLNYHLESLLYKNRFLYAFTLQQLFYILCTL